VSSVSDSSWFNLLRMAGAVTTTSSPAMFNVKYGGKKKRGKKKDSDEEENSGDSGFRGIGRRIRD